MREHGIPGVNSLAFGARGPRLRAIKFSRFKHAPLTVLIGMILIQCTVLRIMMLTGETLCRESYPLCR